MPDHSQPSPAVNRLGHWILLAAACNIAGWTLSLIGWLTPPGLAIAIPLFWFILARLCGLTTPALPEHASFRSWKQRKSKWLPAGFLLIALLALAGGLIHPPNNLDAMNYRMPRVADWLMERRWEWIPANNNSLNTRSCGFEWLMAPMIAWGRTDRLIFLPNLISFLFLPGLVFSVFRQFGIHRKVAWAWMWVLPSGYCFTLQAASAGNDLPAAVFALAAFDFGFRWRHSGNLTCLALALAAAGMMTAIKPTTLPLLLPFAVLFFGMWKPLLRRPLKSAVLAILLGLASFLPTATINFQQCGDWTGAKAENPTLGRVVPWVGLAGNAINLPIQNLAPPVFPLARTWNSHFIQLFPESFRAAMKRDFEANGARFALPDFQGEEWVGIGAGISYLIILSAVLGLPRRPSDAFPPGRIKWCATLGLLFGTALLAYFSRAGMSTVARHMTPYYIPLIGILLLAVPQSQVVKMRIWKAAAMIAMASCVMLMVITPSRPLWPAQWFFTKVTGDSTSPFLKRAAEGYAVYADRADSLGGLRDALPANVKLIGFMSCHTGPELPLWKPYLTRSVRHIRSEDSLAELQAAGMNHVILNVLGFEERLGITPDAWLALHHGKILKRESLQILAKEAASEWWAVELPEPPARHP